MFHSSAETNCGPFSIRLAPWLGEGLPQECVSCFECRAPEENPWPNEIDVMLA